LSAKLPTGGQNPLVDECVATVIAESKKFSLFLISNFIYCKNAIPIRVELVCWLNFENWIEGTEDNEEDILFNKLRC
jgi:hypothetical protein